MMHTNVLSEQVLTTNQGIGQAHFSPAQGFGYDFAVVLDARLRRAFFEADLDVLERRHLLQRGAARLDDLGDGLPELVIFDDDGLDREVVLEPDFFERLPRVVDFLFAQIANRDAKSIAANVLRAERRRCPAKIFDAQSSLLESPLGAVKNGEVLNGKGVTILEAAEPNTWPLDFPAPPNELQSIERVEIPLLQPV